MVEDTTHAAALDDDMDGEPPGGRHSHPDGPGKGAWLATLGLTPADLLGKIIVVAGYKGGIGKTFLALELAWLLDAVLVDLDWDRGNASRSLGYREETRVGVPLLNALERKQVPRPLAGGPWRTDFVPCHSDFEANQPAPDKMAEHLEKWAAAWGSEQRRATVVDTHPGGVPSTFGAVSAAHLVIVPVVLGEREMEATEGLVEELRSYPLLLVPNEVGISPPARFIDWLDRISRTHGVPVAPVIGKYDWLRTRKRRMALCASHPVPVRARPLVGELHRVGEAVVKHVRLAA